MWLTIIAIILAILALIVAVGGALYVWIYWRLIQRPLPEWEGEFQLDCLAAPVEVLRDKHGVPHIYAQSRADLYRAQGYVHAQDRLWQMEQHRRIAAGTLAEVFGAPALEADRFSRIVGFRRAAQAELDALDAESRQVLEWYAEGVNAYIAERPRRLAAEFNLLRFAPQPWTPLDTVGYAKVMGWSLCVNWESEITRLRLALHMDPYRAAELEPEYPPHNPVILEALGAEEATRLMSSAGLLLNQYEQIKQWLSQHGAQVPGEGQGSNSWALAPKASLNGRPLLANDPHLSVAMPGPFYENHLICPDLEVSGASLPGSPGVLIGHNEHIAWGMTNAFVDVQDLYVERRHPEDDTRYEYNGQWEQAQVIEEIINVRRGQSHVERVIVTRHGPLISRLLDGQTFESKAEAARVRSLPLALRWTGHEPGGLVRAVLKMNEARNWDEFDAALADWSLPPQNIVYTDAEGYIGYVMAGKAPVRDKNLGLLPAPGWTDEYEWSGYIPHAELPRIYNPASGRIVTANNKMTGDDYPYFLGIEYYPGWRAARLEEMLSFKERHSFRDMQEMQNDNVSKFAEALAPWMAQAGADTTWERVGHLALRDWNHRLEVDSVGATVFHYTLQELLERTFGDKLGVLMPNFLGIASNPLFGITGMAMRAENRLLQLIESQEHSPWYTEAQSGRERTREELIKEAFKAAVRRLSDEIGESSVRWQWGRHHQVRFVHPLGSVRLLRTFFNRGPYPIGGDANTPMQTRHSTQLPLELVRVAPAYRQIFEVGQWDRAVSVTINGQSGHPLSRQYDDQIPMWREGVYHKMPWSRAAVEEETVYRMNLRSEAK